MTDHYFPAGGRCVWCKTTPEKVADRKAPPYCPERPDDTREDRRDGLNDSTGY